MSLLQLCLVRTQTGLTISHRVLWTGLGGNTVYLEKRTDLYPLRCTFNDWTPDQVRTPNRYMKVTKGRTDKNLTYTRSTTSFVHKLQ